MPYSARSEARPFSAKISSRDHPDFRPLKSVAGDLSEPCRLPVAWMNAAWRRPDGHRYIFR